MVEFDNCYTLGLDALVSPVVFPMIFVKKSEVPTMLGKCVYVDPTVIEDSALVCSAQPSVLGSGTHFSVELIKPKAAPVDLPVLLWINCDPSLRYLVAPAGGEIYFIDTGKSGAYQFVNNVPMAVGGVQERSGQALLVLNPGATTVVTIPKRNSTLIHFGVYNGNPLVFNTTEMVG